MSRNTRTTWLARQRTTTTAHPGSKRRARHQLPWRSLVPPHLRRGQAPSPAPGRQAVSMSAPEVNCLRDDVHAPHPWRSLTHSWSCPGRTVALQLQRRIAQGSARPQDPWSELRGGPMDPGPVPGQRLLAAMQEEYARRVDDQADHYAGLPQLVPTRVVDPLWMRVVSRLSTADWWAIGTAAVVGIVGGVLVGAWWR